MKKSKPLHIRIPEPCNQTWSHMTVNENGRYCDRCSKTVLDFSGMTDIELVNYFQAKPANVCGRFSVIQLDRNIVPLKPKRLLPSLYRKVAAAILAIMSLRFSTAQVQKKATTPITSQPTTNRSVSLPDSILITGRVTQNYSQPIANARISFDGLLETYTDVEGKFHLQLSTEMMAGHNLYFSAAGYKKAVRNFHPMMGSTEYNVVLESPDECAYRYTMGGIRLELHDFPSIAFARSEAVLIPDDKLLLAAVAEHMKQEPQMSIRLVAYGKGIIGTKKAKRKIELITNYLVKEQGISKERIKQQVDKISGVKLVDILQDEESGF